jgi:DNA repair protein RadD
MFITEKKQSVYSLLRDYQIKLVDDLINAYNNGCTAPLAVAPTGAGKSIILAATFEYFLEQDMRIGLIVHKEELLTQSLNMIEKFFPHIPRSVLGNKTRYGKLFDPNCQIHIMTIKCLYGAEFKPEIDLLAFDEAHHIPANEWAGTLHYYRDNYPSMKFLGATATPVRLDGKGLRNLEIKSKNDKKKIKVAGFDHISVGPQTAELIEQGHLVPIKLYAGSKLAIAEGSKMQAGDFKADDMAVLVENEVPLTNIVEQWATLAYGKRTVIYTVSVEYSKHLETEYNNTYPGIAKHIDANTPDDERKRAIADFADGKILVLLQFAIIVEGVDIPAIECVVHVRPTASIVQWFQSIGRALRPAPGKDCMILLDFTDNHLRLPMPTDQIEWSLDGYKNHNFFYCDPCGKERRHIFLHKDIIDDHETHKHYECCKCGNHLIDIKKSKEKEEREKREKTREQIALKEKELAKKNHHLIPQPDFYEYWDNKDHYDTDTDAILDYIRALHEFRIKLNFKPKWAIFQIAESFYREDIEPNNEIYFLIYQVSLGPHAGRLVTFTIAEVEAMAQENDKPYFVDAMREKIAEAKKAYPYYLKRKKEEVDSLNGKIADHT